MSSEQKNFVVMAQRRSGSSMVAGMMHNLGIDMGPNAERASERNPHGFFEDEHFVQISREIISNVASGNATKADLDQQFRPRIKELVKQRNKANTVWGYKDVNQVQTHMLFRQHLKNPQYVFVWRNPLDTALSLADWHDLDIPSALQAVNSNNGLMIDTIMVTQSPMLFLSYERVLKDPEKAVDDIIQFAELEPTKEQRKAAIDHVKQK